MAQSLPIQINSLTHQFGTRTAVHNLELEVPPGSLYAFLGHNGAGKTTTIRLLMGLLPLQQGAVRVFGHDIKTHRRDILQRVGALVEEPALYLQLTAREHLQMFARIRQIPVQRIVETLAIVGLTPNADRRVRQYSQGMRQRLGLAMALLPDPDLLVLDEPSNGMDPGGIREMRELLKTLVHEHGKTVFVSSHLLAEVERMATHVAILDHGHLRYQGTMAGLAQQRGAVRLHLEVDNPEAARTLLAQFGWSVLPPTAHQEDVGNALRVALTAHEQVPQVVLQLVEAGIGIHAVKPHDSLEDIFFTMTEPAVKAK